MKKEESTEPPDEINEELNLVEYEKLIMKEWRKQWNKVHRGFLEDNKKDERRRDFFLELTDEKREKFVKC